jgi:hypothetical protein
MFHVPEADHFLDKLIGILAPLAFNLRLAPGLGLGLSLQLLDILMGICQQLPEYTVFPL